MGSDISKLNFKDCCCKDVTETINKNCEREVESFSITNNAFEEKSNLIEANNNVSIDLSSNNKINSHNVAKKTHESNKILKVKDNNHSVSDQNQNKQIQDKKEYSNIMNTLKNIKEEKQKSGSSENDLMMSQNLKMELEVIKKNSNKKSSEHENRNSDSDSESGLDLNLHNERDSEKYETYKIEIHKKDIEKNNNDKNNTDDNTNKSKIKIKNSKLQIITYDSSSKNSSKSSKGFNINIKQSSSINVNLKTGNLSNLKIRKLASVSAIGLSPFRQNSEKSYYKKLNEDGNVCYTQCGEIAEKHKEFLKQKLKQTIPWLKHINDSENNIIQKVINKCVRYVCKEGEILYNDNEFGSQLYIIYSGKFGFFSKNNSIKAVYVKGNILGDMNANNNKFELEKDWHVKCIYDNSVIFIIESEDLMKIQNSFIDELCNKYIDIFNNHAYLKYLNNFEKMTLSNEITILKPKKDTILQSVGQKVDCLYFIITGSIIEINLFGEIVKEYKVNESINEKLCLFDYNSENEFRINNKETTLICISSSKLQEVLDTNFQDQIIFSIFNYVCKENENFSKIVETFTIDSENLIYFNSNKNLNTPNLNAKNTMHSIIVKDSSLKKVDRLNTNSSVNINNDISKSSKTKSSLNNNDIYDGTQSNNNQIVHSHKDANNNDLNPVNSFNSKIESDFSSSEVSKEINISSGIFKNYDNIEHIIDSNLHAKNIYRNVYEKFVKKIYLKGEKIYIYEEKKTGILIQGNITSIRNKNKVVYFPSILGAMFYEQFM